ncbi:SdpI family protein [Actinomyces viscosus]|uniref:Predicted integral membrane protein n=1 Tax=Actinomyces viscosus TaxID=1656 RepID=A0A3S4VUZ7_ACTVI|nr:SdpI family protein [Actinomyces viscosus]TFH53688.1 SdpI family protein [Actinomyces viscosus]VEI14266.1 Predicted integral membrane protein [Actinomyces viscosus]
MAETAFSVLMILLLGAAGILLLVTGRRMSQRKLPPNSWAGVRYAVALQSEENWYEMQARCATATMGLGVVFIDSALLFAIQAALPEAISILIPMAVMFIQMVAGVALIHVQARRCRTHLLRNAN